MEVMQWQSDDNTLVFKIFYTVCSILKETENILNASLGVWFGVFLLPTEHINSSVFDKF